MARTRTPPFGPIPPYSLQYNGDETVTGARSEGIVSIITNRCARIGTVIDRYVGLGA
jgi:hypothetical protein